MVHIDIDCAEIVLTHANQHLVQTGRDKFEF